MVRAILAAVLGLAITSPALAQNFAPPPPPVARPGAPAATICSTDYGWCPIQYAATSRGGYCACFYPPNNNWILGRGRYWPYDPVGVSPYLNAHTGPPATLR